MTDLASRLTLGLRLTAIAYLVQWLAIAALFVPAVVAHGPSVIVTALVYSAWFSFGVLWTAPIVYGGLGAVALPPFRSAGVARVTGAVVGVGAMHIGIRWRFGTWPEVHWFSIVAAALGAVAVGGWGRDRGSGSAPRA